MNPWAFIAIAVGILLIIIAVKGTQHNITATISGHQTGGAPAKSSGNAPTGPVLA